MRVTRSAGSKESNQLSTPFRSSQKDVDERCSEVEELRGVAYVLLSGPDPAGPVEADPELTEFALGFLLAAGESISVNAGSLGPTGLDPDAPSVVREGRRPACGLSPRSEDI